MMPVKHLDEILELITLTPKPSLNAHADIFHGARGLNFSLCLHLHPNIVHASREGFCGSSVIY